MTVPERSYVGKRAPVDAPTAPERAVNHGQQRRYSAGYGRPLNGVCAGQRSHGRSSARDSQAQRPVPGHGCSTGLPSLARLERAGPLHNGSALWGRVHTDRRKADCRVTPADDRTLKACRRVVVSLAGKRTAHCRCVTQRKQGGLEPCPRLPAVPHMTASQDPCGKSTWRSPDGATQALPDGFHGWSRRAARPAVRQPTAQR